MIEVTFSESCQICRGSGVMFTAYSEDDYTKEVCDYCAVWSD